MEGASERGNVDTLWKVPRPRAGVRTGTPAATSHSGRRGSAAKFQHAEAMNDKYTNIYFSGNN